MIELLTSRTVPVEKITNARSLLKSKSSQSKEPSSVVEQMDRKLKAEEPEVKVKRQQPLISLKTSGLFGKKF